MDKTRRYSGINLIVLAALILCCSSCGIEPSAPSPPANTAVEKNHATSRTCKLYSDAEALGFKRKLESLNPKPIDYKQIGIVSNRISICNSHKVVMNRDSRHWPIREYYLLSHNYWMLLYRDAYGSGGNGITSISIERTTQNMHPDCPQQSPAGDVLKAVPLKIDLELVSKKPAVGNQIEVRVTITNTSDKPIKIVRFSPRNIIMFKSWGGWDVKITGPSGTYLMQRHGSKKLPRQVTAHDLCELKGGQSADGVLNISGYYTTEQKTLRTIYLDKTPGKHTISVGYCYKPPEKDRGFGTTKESNEILRREAYRGPVASKVLKFTIQ
jgi:hypothetical protein